MVDVCNGPFITLREAAKLPELARDGRKPHVASLYRWAGPGGVRGVRLPTWQIGGTRCTTPQAVRDFIRELTRRWAGEAAGDGRRVATPPATEEAVDALRRARTRHSNLS